LEKVRICKQCVKQIVYTNVYVGARVCGADIQNKANENARKRRLKNTITQREQTLTYV